MENDDLLLAREDVANATFINYDFGLQSEVIDHTSFVDRATDDWLKVAYVVFDDDPPEAPSSKVSFHVTFQPGTSMIAEAYALDVRTGNWLGSLEPVRSH